jgi:hypothetical protein
LFGQKAIFSLFWPLFGPLGATFGAFWVWKMAQTGLSGYLQCCSNLVPTCSITNFSSEVYLAYFSIFGPILAFVLPLLEPLCQFFHHFNLEKRPHLVCPDAPCCVPTLFHPVQPKIGPLGRFVWPKGYFQPFLATFWPPWGHIWDILGLANGPNWSAWMSLVLFQPRSNIVSLNSGSPMALIVKMPMLALFGAFLGPRGPKYVKCAELKLERRSVHIVGAEKNAGDTNGRHSQMAYHISHCGL